MEQISHHPPISNFEVEHVDREYQIHGYFQEDFKRNGSNLEFRTFGKTIVDFQDGDRYSIRWPAKILENNIYMKYEEYIRIEQLDGTLTSLVFLGDKHNEEPLGIDGAIYYRDAKCTFNEKATTLAEARDIDEISCNIEGSWVKSCIIDDKKYWNIKQKIALPHIPVTNPLPSDARYREDLVWLWKDVNINYAQNWKNALEEEQRKDAKLRTKYKK